MRSIDSLLAGEITPDGDPLLEIASLLASDTVRPSAAAVERFELKLKEWFPPKPPTPFIGRNPLLLILAVLAGTVLLTVVSVLSNPIHSSTPLQTIQPTLATGETDAATFEASITPGGPTLVPFISVVIEGQVEAIDTANNMVFIYGQKVKLKDKDPILTRIKIGDWVRIAGNYDTSNIIIVVVIVIIDGPTGIGNLGAAPPGCKWTGFGNGNIRLKCS